MWTEFRAFLIKTNVLVLAIAFILGVAFAAVVSSLVKDVIMPPVGMLLGKVDESWYPSHQLLARVERILSIAVAA